MSSRLHSTLHLTAMLFPCVVAVLVAGVTPSEARQKRIVSNGCTAEQIQSPTAGQCVDKMEDDIIHNRPTYHALYCSSSGRILCCEYDSTTGAQQAHSCTVLSLPNPSIFTRTHGSLTGGNDAGSGAPAGGSGGGVNPGATVNFGNAGMSGGGGAGGTIR